MKNFKSAFTIFALITTVFALACQNKKTEWQGTITTENGVIVVHNHKQPMYGENSLVLEEDLSIGEPATTGDYLFSSLRGLTADDSGNIYALDRKENKVFVFDSAGKHLRTFGRTGQGPGEFSLPLTIGLTGSGEIIVEDTRRHLAVFTTEGKHLRNLPITKTGLARVSVDSQGNILGIVIKRDKENPRYEIQKFDREMNLLFVLDSTPTPSADTQGLNPFRGSIYYTFDKDDSVVCGIPDRYEIKIYDTTGNLAKRITKEYDPVEITEEEKKEQAEQMPPEIKLSFPKYHNPIRWISTDDEGRIFVMTWERIPEGEGYYHDVFDPEGRYIAKIPLKFRPILIKNTKFYAIREDEQGFHVIKRYKASWRID